MVEGPRYPTSAVEEANVNYRLLVQLFIGLWLWPTAGMAGLEAGLAAYERGDYDTALREIRPLAEEGDARAQSRLDTMYIKGEGVRRMRRKECAGIEKPSSRVLQKRNGFWVERMLPVKASRGLIGPSRR